MREKQKPLSGRERSKNRVSYHLKVVRFELGIWIDSLTYFLLSAFYYLIRFYVHYKIEIFDLFHKLGHVKLILSHYCANLIKELYLNELKAIINLT